MRVKRTRQQDGTVKLSAQMTAEELKKALDYAYGAFASSMGLQPDPSKTVEEAARDTLGITNLSPYIQPFLEERAASLAIDESEIMPAFIPKSVEFSQPKSGKGIDFECIVMPKPSFELSSYEPVTISVVKPHVFEEDVEREMATYEGFMQDFDDPDSREKLRSLVIQKLEDLNAQSFINQQRQAVSIELAKRLEGQIPDVIIRNMFAELLEGLKTQLRSQETAFSDFLTEHGGEENVNMLLMWQARESLRQGYALDAVYRHEKLKITEEDIDATCCTISGLDNPTRARETARAMGKMHVVKETAQRFKASDWAVEQAEVTVREQSLFEE